MTNKRLKEARDCRDQAKAERRALLADADAEQRNALTVNRDKAHRAWMDAVNDGLARNSEAIEAAFTKAAAANKTVRDAIAADKMIVERITKVTGSIDAVMALTKASQDDQSSG